MYVCLPTDLQILYGLLPHLSPGVALRPQGSQVGGIKVQMFGVRPQAVVKPRPPLGIPQHGLHGLQPQGRGALVPRRRVLPVACWEAAPSASGNAKAGARQWGGGEGARTLTQNPVKRGEGPLAAAQQSVEVGGQDLTGAGLSEGAAVLTRVVYIPAGREVPAGLRPRLQIRPQALLLF